MKMMSGGLQAIAGRRLQSILHKATSNRFMAVIVGIVATIALNSSTASTVMTVSFINSGLMNLTQSIGVIMGANVGTTFSGHLVAFRVDAYAPAFIFLGVILYIFFKNKKVRDIGHVILGFGILFFGITTMGGPLRQLANLPEFANILTAFENPFMALLAGFAFTAAVQSSTAATGILIGMHVVGVPIPFETSAFIILGTNIGTSLTTMLASIPANRESKRAALFHITYDIIGSAFFGTLIFLAPGILGWFESTWSEPANQVAWFHTLYNVATLLILLPFVKYLAKLMERVIPIQAVAVDTYEKELMYINKEIMQTQSIAPNLSSTMAVRNARLELGRMGKIAVKNLELAMDSFFEENEIKARKVLDNEEIVNYLNQEITARLAEISHMALSTPDAETVGKMYRTASDMERISDHAENIAEYTFLIRKDGLNFSLNARAELKQLTGVTMQLLEESLKAFRTKNASKIDHIKSLEQEVDALAKQFAENHIKRLKDKACDPRCGVVFVDLLTDLERSGDHAYNIAQSVEGAS